MPRSDALERFAWGDGQVVWSSRAKGYGDPNSTQERVEHGRFGPGSGGGSDPGFRMAMKLNDAVAARAAAVYGLGTARGGNAAAKQENVHNIGKSLVGLAKSDPALADQLARAGSMLVNELGEMTVDVEYGYKQLHDRLGYSGDEFEAGTITQEEVGARLIADTLQSTWASTSSDNTAESVALQLAVADRFDLRPQALDELKLAQGSDNGHPIFYFADEADAKLAPLGVDLPTPTGPEDVSFRSLPGEEPQVVEPQQMYTVGDMYNAIADSPAVKAYVDTVYADTQRFLAANNIDNVTLSRGMHFYDERAIPDQYRANAVRPVDLAPLSSWATSGQSAANFANTAVYGAVLQTTFPAERIFSVPVTGNGCLGESEVVVIGGETNTKVTEHHGE